MLRADSAYYGHDVLAAALRQGARFSVTARQDKAIGKAITTIGDDAWTTINHTHAVFDEDSQRWISDAEVAEIDYTAFTSKPKARHISARLIVRRVKDMNPNNQSELFTAYRYHAVFTSARSCGRSRRSGRCRPRAVARGESNVVARGRAAPPRRADANPLPPRRGSAACAHSHAADGSRKDDVGSAGRART